MNRILSPLKRCVCRLALLLSASQVAVADPVVLTVSANGETRSFSLQELDRLPQVSFETSTPWTGVKRFSGPRVAELLKGTAPYKVKAFALNDYSVELNQDQVKNYDVIIASRMDGKPMRIRNKGPLWVVFPLDQHPELDVIEVHSQMIWQLNKLEISQ